MQKAVHAPTMPNIAPDAPTACSANGKPDSNSEIPRTATAKQLRANAENDTCSSRGDYTGLMPSLTRLEVGQRGPGSDPHPWTLVAIML